MHRPHNFLGSLSARRVDDHTVQVTRVRLDEASGRMTFEQVATIAADPTDDQQVQQCLFVALGLLIERDELDGRQLGRPPLGG